LEWVGTPEWLDAYMTPRKPLKPYDLVPGPSTPCNLLNFHRFIQTTPTCDRDVLRAELLKAICEVFLVHEAGRPIGFIPPSNINWPTGVQIVFNPDTQSASIRFASDEDRTQLIDQLTRLPREGEVPAVGKSSKEGEPMGSELSEDQQPTRDYTSSTPEFELHTEEFQEVSDIGNETESRLGHDTVPQAGMNPNPLPVTVSDSKWKQISLADLEIRFNVRSFSEMVTSLF
jgi:hypothetical protein